jgi:hypothetical protein
MLKDYLNNLQSSINQGDAIHETLRIRDLIDEIYEMTEREVITF